MPDDKRTRSLRPSESPPLGEAAAENDVGLEDTIAPDQSEVALDATIAQSIQGTLDDHEDHSDDILDEKGTALARGESVGRYVVLDLLGKGGMGEVYTAYDPELDRRIALKVIHTSIRSGSDPSAAQARLLREAQTLAKLSHPNVVAVYDVGAVEGTANDIYVAMEFIEGSDLRKWLDAGERSLDEILEVFVAAANGLAAAHDEGLVHRDVKPDNILIGDDGRVRVIDFGIAQKDESPRQGEADALIAEISRRRSRDSDQTTAELDSGALIGTPAYMTPEQFLGNSAGGRSDQFSLCVALFEAISGERPFPGKTLPELSSNVLENKRRELTIGPDMPAWLAAALEKGLAPEPNDRHEDMRALAAALERPAPTSNKGRWLLAAAAVIGIGGASAAYVVGGAKATRESCASAAQDIDAIWSDATQAEIKEAFASAGATHGNESYLRIEKVLDTYASGWSQTRIRACEEASSGAMTTATSEKKLACLDGGLREMRAVTTVLASADADVVEEAVNTASALTPLANCSNLTRLTSSPTLEPELDQRLATVKALERAGRYKQGAKEVAATLERADALGSKVGRARALVWRGRLESQLGDGKAAIESLFEAILLAEEAGDTYARAHAWTYVVFVVGSKQRKRLEALRWSQHAAVAIKQDGSPLDLESRRLYHEAYAHRGLRRFEKSRAVFGQANEFAVQAFGKGSYSSLLALMGEAMSLRSLQRFDESVAVYLQVLAGMEELLGPDNPKLAAVHTNLGIVLVELHRYEEGRKHYERSLELKRKKLGPEHPSVLITEINVAILDERLGNFAAAASGVKAVHEVRLRRFGDNYRQLASTLMIRAWLMTKLGHLREAEIFARDAINRYAVRGEDSRESTAWAEVTLCNVLRLARRLGPARTACKSAVKRLREKAEDKRTLAGALSHLAQLELDAGRAALAVPLAEEAQSIRTEHASSTSDRTLTLYVLARALEATNGSRERARRLANQAKSLLAELHAGDQTLLRDGIEALQARLALAR